MAARVGSVVLRAPLKNYSVRLRGRTYSSTTGTPDANSIPLSQPLPWLPPPKYATVTDKTYETQITTLDNGLRVATHNKLGQFCTVGVVLDSGSRYEVAYPSGITHFLQKLAFASTTKYPNSDDIHQLVEKHGGISDCQGARDSLIYAMSANRNGLPEVVSVLSEVVLRPEIKQEELEDSRAAIRFEIETLNTRPDPEPLLIELIHAAAYRNNTLGLPKICPEESINMIDRGMLYTYMNSYHTPERTVLAGVGIEHDDLVKLAEEHFVKKRPIWEEHKDILDLSREKDLSISQYTGGYLPVEKDLSSVSQGPNPMPELAHCVIGLESCPHTDQDYVAFCVLNMMMGGGGSFSAGGPGKGMYSRLYLNVLNRFHWIHNATAYNHAYTDSGMFCIYGSAHPSNMRTLIEVLVSEFINTQHAITTEELERAKTQLQSMLLMNLETMAVVFEDVGLQVLCKNHRKSAQEYFDEIGAITKEDIQRVARRMLQSTPSVTALGDLAQAPSYVDIQKALNSKDGKLPKRFTLFR